jgi:branched-chain amino acid transport system ATP-binding protein
MTLPNGSGLTGSSVHTVRSTPSGHSDAPSGYSDDPAGRSDDPSSAQTVRENPLLSIRDVTVKFGGIVALDEVSFSLDAGQIVGLIGPNGAGKTTCFNCVSRLYTPTVGEIRFDGHSIVSARPERLFKVPAHVVPQLGIGRTFQNVALFPTMTVLQNVMVGVHSQTRAAHLSHALRLPRARREDRQIRDAAMDVIEFLELGAIAHRPATGLPFGTLKRIELARGLASRPKLLLLDEPAGGLNHEEVEALGSVIRSIRDRRNVSVLLVEHHMGLVMAVSDKVVVLNFGRKIAEDTPAEIRRHPDVITAYLGKRG